MSDAPGPDILPSRRDAGGSTPFFGQYQGEGTLKTTKRSMDLAQKAGLIVKAALDKQAYGAVVLDVSRLCSYTDRIVIMHGTSTRQVQAIAQNVRETLKKAGEIPLGFEGERDSQWLVVDFGDVVVHVFYEPMRAFYDLEGIWADAARAQVQETQGDVRIVWPERSKQPEAVGLL